MCGDSRKSIQGPGASLGVGRTPFLCTPSCLHVLQDLFPSGPTHWKEMAPACGGPQQSPINIDLHLVQRDPSLGPLIFQGYDSAPPGRWMLENDGHTGQ